MTAGKNHFLFFVKKMRPGPLHAGIQMQFLAVGNFGQLNQPVKKFFAAAFPSGSGKRHQIVNVKKFSARQMFTKPITGDGGNFAIGFEEDEKITPALKSPDGREKIFQLQMRAQFAQDGKAADNVFVCFRRQNENCLHGKNLNRCPKTRKLKRTQIKSLGAVHDQIGH